MKVSLLYDTPGNIIPAKWVLATMETPIKYLVQCRRSRKGQPMKILCEDIRTDRTGKITQSLLHSSAVDILGVPPSESGK